MIDNVKFSDVNFYFLFSVYFISEGLVQDCSQHSCLLNKSWRQHSTRLLSRKLFKLDEPDMQDTAGEARTNS